MHLLLCDGNKILFARHQNTNFEDDAYHVSSGPLEAGESLIAALIRKAKKIGVAIAPEAIELTHLMHNSSSSGRIAFFFTVRRWDGTPKTMSQG